MAERYSSVIMSVENQTRLNIPPIPPISGFWTSLAKGSGFFSKMLFFFSLDGYKPVTGPSSLKPKHVELNDRPGVSIS